MIAVLLTSAGGDSAMAVCEALRAHFGQDIRLVGVDLKPVIACVPLLDAFVQVPPRRSADYVPTLARIASAHQATHVWPLSTEDQEIIAAHKDRELEAYTAMCSTLDAVRTANHKIRLYEFARAHGLPVPDYRIVKDSGTLEDSAGELGYPERPVVLKAATGTGAAGLKILRAAVSPLEMFLSRVNRDMTLQGALAQLDGVSPWPEMMLTEYLPGEEFSVDVLSYQGKYCGGVVRRRDDSVFGLATDATVVDRPDVLQIARRFVESVGLDYVSNVQLRCASGGEPKLMEINPRVPGTIGLSVGAGVNLPAAALELSLGRHVSLAEPRYGTRILRYYGGTVLKP